MSAGFRHHECASDEPKYWSQMVMVNGKQAREFGAGVSCKPGFKLRTACILLFRSFRLETCGGHAEVRLKPIISDMIV